MANEITITGSLGLSRSAAPAAKISKSLSGQVNQTGNKYHSGVQSIGSGGEENLAKGDIGTVGWFIVKNLDGTNYVTLGTVTAQRPIRVNAGEFVGPIRVNAANVIAQADTADCIVEYLLVEL